MQPALAHQISTNRIHRLKEKNIKTVIAKLLSLLQNKICLTCGIMREYEGILNKYLPDHTSKIISEWISKYSIYLRITKSRSTKLGDYYPPTKYRTHKITINHDLNKYAFLITLVHEIAHLLVWEKHKNRTKPHGTEWKIEFKNLMDMFLRMDVFPADIRGSLANYLENAKASTISDIELSRILSKYNINNTKILLENIPDNSVFKLKNGKIFRKGEKLRKRYRCICLNNKRLYLINPLVEVFPVK